MSYVVCDCVWGGDVRVYSFLYDTLGEDMDEDVSYVVCDWGGVRIGIFNSHG